MILHCRQIKVKKIGFIKNIVRANGCGFVNRNFYLCPTIAIAMSLCKNYGSLIESKYLETEFVFYIHSIWGGVNPLSKKEFNFDGMPHEIIKLGVKHLLSEAESQWMNLFEMSRNNS